MFLAPFQMGRPRDNLSGWTFRVAHNLGLKRRIASRRTANAMDDSVFHGQADPGPNRLMKREEVCSAGAEENVRVVPASLRRRVFEEYGMPQGRAEAFEVDYLVTPEIGGADDIRNLWPQPYDATVWNAHVKDALEDRLHQMVCSGQVDLATAQRDLAKDWISAYKKCFHTDKPY